MVAKSGCHVGLSETRFQFVFHKACRPGATEEVWQLIFEYADKQMTEYSNMKVKGHADSSKVQKDMLDMCNNLQAVMKVGHPKHAENIGKIVCNIQGIASNFETELQELELKTALAGHWCVCCWVCSCWGLYGQDMGLLCSHGQHMGLGQVRVVCMYG